jgi:hypothetical protein
MVTKRMTLFAKRFRSKAPSAAPLSPVLFADRRGIGFYFLPTIYCDTVSLGRGGVKGGLTRCEVGSDEITHIIQERGDKVLHLP